MYFQPYGDEQQLNLNWIINEIINLHKQLDPDYETPSFTQIYPYSNLNRLNLDWVLSELKALKELAPEPSPELDIQTVAEALVALPFDSNTSYQIYDFISKDGEIWRATQAIAAGGVWDETKWFKTKIGTDLAVLERWINAINNSLTSLQNTVANLSSADISDDSDAGGATVKASLNNLKGSLNTEVTTRQNADNAIEAAIAYVESNWESASRTYTVGEYFYSSQYNRLYKVTVATPQGTSFENHVAWMSSGGFNDLAVHTSEEVATGITGVYTTLLDGWLVRLQFYITSSITVPHNNLAASLGTLPAKVRPKGNQNYLLAYGKANGAPTVFGVRVAATGDVIPYNIGDTDLTYATIQGICYYPII